MFSDLKPYPGYAEDGGSWFPAVPHHWSVRPMRALFDEVRDADHADEPLLSVTITRGVVPQAEHLAGSSKKDSSNLDKSKYKLVLPSDIAYNKMRAWQGALGVSRHRGIVSPAYIVERPRSDLKADYAHHLLRTPGFVKEAERWSYGITSDMWSLRPEHFKLISCPVPPPEEQVAIVRYLAHANRRIDQAIAAKRKLIRLLEEQKRVLTTQAITKGLDDSTETKDSGVAWIGAIPMLWLAWPIGRLARVGNGSTPARSNPGYWDAGHFPWLNSSSVNQGIVRTADQFVTATALSECHLPVVPPGSVLIAITGQGKTRGTAAVLEIEATINQHMAFLTPDTRIIRAAYLKATLDAAYPELRRISDDSGSTKGALTCGDLKAFRVPVPPLVEQQRILDFVHQETRQMDQAIVRAAQEIDLLREFRTRLTADVVTGQVDVRGVAASLPDVSFEELAESVDGSLDDELDELAEEFTEDAALV